MKYFILIAVCLAVAHAQTPSKKLENTLIGLRDQMPCGFPDMGIPVLAPFTGDYFNLFHKLWILKIYGSASDFTINGLNNFNINKVSLNVLTLKVEADLNFKNIHAVGKYNIESFVIGILKLRGNGKFDIKLSDLSIKLYARIGMVEGVLRMMDLDVVIGLDAMKSKITGLTGPLGALVLSSIVDKVVVNYISDNEEAITDNIREMLLPEVDKVMQGFTIADVLNLLQNPTERPECIARAA